MKEIGNKSWKLQIKFQTEIKHIKDPLNFGISELLQNALHGKLKLVKKAIWLQACLQKINIKKILMDQNLYWKILSQRINFQSLNKNKNHFQFDKYFLQIKNIHQQKIPFLNQKYLFMPMIVVSIKQSKLQYRLQLEMNEIEIDIDLIINKLLELRNQKPGKTLYLQQYEILGLIRLAKAVFMKQNMLVEVSAPVRVCGDIHGQYSDLLRLFQYGGLPPESSYLFLGDYVDRGKQGIQTICLLFAYKIKYQDKVFILRGNHESASITRIYGFFDQCKLRYSAKLWKSFVDCFNCMPVAALIEEKILCMHGGLSPDLISTDQINNIIRPTDVPDTGLLCDLLWADPDSSVKGWGQSERGVSYVFGGDVVTSFLKKNQLDLICRAHQVVQDGYQFFNKRQLVTIFSAPNYCGEFNNSGAMMNINQTLACCFQVLRPQQKVGPYRNGRPKTPIKRGGGL